MTFLREAGGLGGVNVVPAVPVKKRPCWNLGTVILMGVMSAKLLIYIYKIFSSSSSSREKMAWFQGSSEKRAISLLQKITCCASRVPTLLLT